ncbi:hypothetical protein [Amycolatopsis sp. NBRC 101858]|uniref:hypothetical protein n=1 Tax=Amycolatopsis sp. NBRC 101858 TaxID=3032200 RepID=UPI002556E640|nr:hypothetical protein [Amycolatopsis sp. NBRC 101858]
MGTDTDRHWPARHGGGYPPGWQVRFRGRRQRGPAGRDLIGTIAGPSLRDEHTSTTWVPVRPRPAAPDIPPILVRAQDILDARPPGEPALESEEAGGRKVVVELPERGPDGHPVR